MNLGGIIFDADDIEKMERVALNDAIYGMERHNEPHGFEWAEESMRILSRVMTRNVVLYDLLSLSDMASTDGYDELSKRLNEAFEALVPFAEGDEE